MIYQAVFLDPAGWTRRRRLPRAPAGRHLRGRRHEARAAREAGVHPPALLLLRAGRAHPGTRAASSCTSCSARASACLSPRGVRRVLPARPRPARAVRRRPAARPSRGRVAHCDDLRLPAACARATGTPSTTSRASPASAARRSTSSRAAGIATLAALGRAPEEPPPGFPADTFAQIREQAELQLAARETGRDSYVLLQPQPESGFALLPDPSPGDLFFDFEGNPFWDASGGLEYLWGILDVERNFTPLHAHDHATERARVRAVRRPRPRAARRASPTCTSTTTRSTRSPRCAG